MKDSRIPRRRPARVKAAPSRDQEFAIEHRDGTLTDLDLWRDILDPDDIAELEKLAKTPPGTG